METKRLKSLVESSSSQSSTAMMSYCIIRSKLKKAKRDGHQFQVCAQAEACEPAILRAEQWPEVDRCCPREAVPSFLARQQTNGVRSSGEHSPDLPETLSPASRASKASQTPAAISRVRGGSSRLSAPPSPSREALDPCQPKNGETRRPPGRKSRPDYASPSWGVALVLALLSLSLAGQQQVREQAAPRSILETIYESALAAISGRQLVLVAEAQYRPEWPSKSLQQEIFLLNLEDGYFGCQVNESQDFLQLFELSRLCDGQTQCYLGTDEMVAPLKCNNRERCGTHQNSRGQQESTQCMNGVCLDGLCYCNDGFGGKSCDVPDENECKFRPCDVFAHCTNTMGSYYCSCFPGKSPDPAAAGSASLSSAAP